MTCIATVYSHFGAMRLRRELEKLGISGTLMPVPRQLSSSCGTCLRFDAPEGFLLNDAHGEVETLAEVTPGGYRVMWTAEEST